MDRLQEVYSEYCKGGNCRDELWSLVHDKAEEVLKGLLKKTHVQMPKQERKDLLSDSVCVAIKRLDKKEPIKHIGGVVYFATSNRLRSAKFRHHKESAEVPFSELPYCESATDY